MDEYVTEFNWDSVDEFGNPWFVTRERIVRCRDCEHAHPCPLADSEKLMCAFHDEMFVNPDGFCAWAKPREEG